MDARAAHRQALALLLVANAFWGLSFPLMKALMLIEARIWPGGSGSLLVAGTLAPRFVVSAVVVLLVSARLVPLATSGEVKQGLWVGLFASGGMLLQNDGLRFTAASTSAFLTQFYAILIPVFLAFRHRRPPGLVVAAASLLVLAGVAVLGHFDWRELHLGRGELETLLSSMLFMGQILSLDQPAFRGNRTLPVTWVMFLVEGLAFGSLALACSPHAAVWAAAFHSPSWLGCTAVLTLGCTILTYIIMNGWQPKISATEAGLMYCFEPIFGSLLALCVPGLLSAWAGIAYANERVTANLLIGGGLITAANILIQWKPPPRPA